MDAYCSCAHRTLWSAERKAEAASRHKKKEREEREREERAAGFERRAAVTGKHGDTIPTIPSLVIPKG